jgi:hypothetical protein
MDLLSYDEITLDYPLYSILGRYWISLRSFLRPFPTSLSSLLRAERLACSCGSVAVNQASLLSV